MSRLKRQRGYLVIAQRSKTHNYLRMAYGLALSLKATQSEVPHLSVAVKPGTKIPKKYADAFDEVIEIPWADDAEGQAWKIHNKWKVYYMTPYQETVLLDADMIFTTDVSDWWDILGERDLWMTTQPVNYRGDMIAREQFRKIFIDNELPMVYTAFAYFKQGKLGDEFFGMLRKVFHQWYGVLDYYQRRKTPDDVLAAMAAKRDPDRFKWTHFLRDFKPELSGDLAYAFTTKVMGLEELCAPEGRFPTFTHMKLGDQGIERMSGTEWTDMLSWSLKDDLTLLVNNYVQRYPFHYVEKDWLSPEVVRKLEKAANG